MSPCLLNYRIRSSLHSWTITTAHSMAIFALGSFLILLILGEIMIVWCYKVFPTYSSNMFATHLYFHIIPFFHQVFPFPGMTCFSYLFIINTTGICIYDTSCCISCDFHQMLVSFKDSHVPTALVVSFTSAFSRNFVSWTISICLSLS